MHSRIGDIFRRAPPPSLTASNPPKKTRKPRRPSAERSSKKIKEMGPIIIPQETPTKKRKQHIPLALREQVWLKRMGKVFHGKCNRSWCQNTITVFDFQSGHDIPESKGGPTTLENLIPLCSRCNNSMGNGYTFNEWCALSPDELCTVPVIPKSSKYCCF